MKRSLRWAETPCLLLAVVCCAGMARPPKSKGPAPAARELVARGVETMEWKGPFCPVSSGKTVVVASAEDWKRLWGETLGRKEEPPAVEFDKHFAVAVFVGSVPTGGYGIEFLEPEVSGGKAVIRYRLRKPAQGGFVIQAFTQPYAVRLFSKTDLPVVVQEAR